MGRIYRSFWNCENGDGASSGDPTLPAVLARRRDQQVSSALAEIPLLPTHPSSLEERRDKRGREVSPMKRLPAMRVGPLLRIVTCPADAADRTIGWDRLPRFLGILTLVGLRTRLRERNLHDTGLTPDKENLEAEEPSPLERAARTIDGRFNDLGHPAMGSLGSRFGRNVALRYTRPEEEPDVLRPNPRVVSRELLTPEFRS
ncbi:MAG: peroxidase family protein [Candidatus Methylomirabilaceae bacterium]